MVLTVFEMARVGERSPQVTHIWGPHPSRGVLQQWKSQPWGRPAGQGRILGQTVIPAPPLPRSQLSPPITKDNTTHIIRSQEEGKGASPLQGD